MGQQLSINRCRRSAAEPETVDFLALLPRELACRVLLFLEPGDVFACAQVCKAWHKVFIERKLLILTERE